MAETRNKKISFLRILKGLKVASQVLRETRGHLPSCSSPWHKKRLTEALCDLGTLVATQSLRT